MTTRTPARPAPVTGRPAPSDAGAAVTRGLVRQLRRGTVVVAVICGGLAAFVAREYERTFSSAIGAGSLAALAENPAIRTLFGPPVALDDPGGFTVWRTGTVLAVLAGVWAALAGTRVTRGEEDAGRAELLLAGRIRLPSLVGRVGAVLLGAGAVVGAAVVLGMLLAGTAPVGAVLFGAVVGGTAMAGGALGVLAGQLLSERRAASGLAVGLLLAGLLARMVGDGVPALSWLQWLSPFGLMTRVAPYEETVGRRCSCWPPRSPSSPPSPSPSKGRGTSAPDAGGAATGAGRRAGCCGPCPDWPCTAPAGRPERGRSGSPPTSCSSACWRPRCWTSCGTTRCSRSWRPRWASPGWPRCRDTPRRCSPCWPSRGVPTPRGGWRPSRPTRRPRA